MSSYKVFILPDLLPSPPPAPLFSVLDYVLFISPSCWRQWKWDVGLDLENHANESRDRILAGCALVLIRFYEPILWL